VPAGKQADWRAGRVDAHGFGATQNNDGKSPLKIGCYVKSFAARRLPSTLPASRFGPVPTAKHTHLDALRSRTVTPETLPRYTHKSYSVNILIRGNLWKKLPSMVSQSHLGPSANPSQFKYAPAIQISIVGHYPPIFSVVVQFPVSPSLGINRMSTITAHFPERDFWGVRAMFGGLVGNPVETLWACLKGRRLEQFLLPARCV
jgi:hypothetical protein